MEKQELFRIGEVARMFSISVGSLRHYEKLGLIRPEYTDPDSGYRYYGVQQFERLNTIRYLRALDMPLEDIADFLLNKDGGKIQEMLIQQRETPETAGTSDYRAKDQHPARRTGRCTLLPAGYDYTGSDSAETDHLDPQPSLPENLSGSGDFDPDTPERSGRDSGFSRKSRARHLQRTFGSRRLPGLRHRFSAPRTGRPLPGHH